MAEYTYKLADGRTMMLSGDVAPTPQDVFEAAKAANVTLDDKQQRSLMAESNKRLAAASAKPTQDEQRRSGVLGYLRSVDEGAMAPGTYLGEGPVRMVRGAADVARGNVKHGAAEIVRGAGVTTLPFAPAAAVAAPAAMLGGLVLGAGSEAAATGLGADPDTATLVGAGGALVGGGIGQRALPDAIPGANVPLQPRTQIAGGLRTVAKELAPTHTMSGRLARFGAEKAAQMLEGAPAAPAAPGAAGGRLTKPPSSMEDILAVLREPEGSAAPSVELPPEPTITPGGRLMGAPAAKGESLGRSVSYTSGNPGPGAVDRPLPVKVGPAARQSTSAPAAPPAPPAKTPALPPEFTAVGSEPPYMPPTFPEGETQVNLTGGRPSQTKTALEAQAARTKTEAFRKDQAALRGEESTRGPAPDALAAELRVRLGTGDIPPAEPPAIPRPSRSMEARVAQADRSALDPEVVSAFEALSNPELLRTLQGPLQADIRNAIVSELMRRGIRP